MNAKVAENSALFP
jgi:F-box/leucine-rich repeat protein 2/20